MATISVLKFGTPDGAAEAIETLQGLARDHLIQVEDAALVSWKEGKKRPKTKQLNDLVGFGAVGGMFWGTLVGMIFLMPLAGAAVGAASGALGGALSDIGINDEFIEKIRAEVTEGTSCLFLMTSGATVDKVVDAMRQHDFEIVSTNLSQDEEALLRAEFAS